jgi:galactitol-specific phosphotransferase system IIB component
MIKRPVKVIVSCGASIAQSTMMQMQLTEEFARRKVPVNILKCTFAELPGKIASFQPDIVFTAGKVPFKIPEGLPAFDGLNIITGFGRQEMFDEVFKLIDTMDLSN